MAFQRDATVLAASTTRRRITATWNHGTMDHGAATIEAAHSSEETRAARHPEMGGGDASFALMAARRDQIDYL